MKQSSRLLLLLLLFVSLCVAQSPESRSCDHQQWLTTAMKEMQTVRPGMTRADLLKVFRGEGGLSTRRSRRYVYHGSPYIKVNVDFDPVGNADGLSEQPDDKIVKISQPYLEWSIFD